MRYKALYGFILYEITFKKTVLTDQEVSAYSMADAERQLLEEYESLDIEIYSIRRIENV